MTEQPTYKKDVFPTTRIADLEVALNRILQISNISWEFCENELIVSGLDYGDPITFMHWRSAKAFLDGYLLGYDHGYGDKKEDGR